MSIIPNFFKSIMDFVNNFCLNNNYSFSNVMLPILGVKANYDELIVLLKNYPHNKKLIYSYLQKPGTIWLIVCTVFLVRN